MTSYPPRIYGIFDVFLSLLNQSVNISSYQCFLTLAKEEFIRGKKDLPLDLQKLIKNRWIKLIWHHNIYSHKKLMPILQAYPENDILIIDDDVIRTNNFIEIFQKDHKSFPRDIICGTFIFYYNQSIVNKKIMGYKGEKTAEFNAIPNIIFQTARPANGFGGVLYPRHTFSDKRFFNESLYMHFSPTSDESWQYIFNIIEDKIFRQTSIIIDNSINFVKGSQSIRTCLQYVNKKNYYLINDNLIKYFPEYKINSLERQKKLIVSLTSSKQNIKYLNLVLESILNNTMKPSKIILTLYKNDYELLPNYVNDLISKKIIELIVTDIDLKSHKKYFYVMNKYRDYAILTIDDDIIYTNDLIESLYNSYIEKPNCIHARCVHKILIKNNKTASYDKWLKQYTFEFNPSFHLFAVSGGGILYPPNILNISDENIGEISNCLIAEDVYLKYLSRKRNIKILWTPNKSLLGLKQISNNSTKEKDFNEINKKTVKNKDSCLNIFPIII